MSGTENTKYDSLHILCRNGWTWHSYDTDPIIQMNDPNGEYFVYTNTFLGWYTTTVMAAVSAHSGHLCIDGHYGVLWLAAAKYECDPPYSIQDLEDMVHCVEIAEEHLLTIGMPFTKDYKFSNDGNGEKKKRNDELRMMYNLDELERKEEE